MAANYFGHFLLTCENTCISGRFPEFDFTQERYYRFSDLQSESNYSKFEAYGQSKLACLLFAKELQRRLDRYDHGDTLSLAAHPGEKIAVCRVLINVNHRTSNLPII